jgi:hypothetical protein
MRHSDDDSLPRVATWGRIYFTAARQALDTKHEPGTCAECGDADSLATCTVCGEPVCPRHRVGTGRLADGYTCMSEGRRCFAERGKLLLTELTKVIGQALERGMPHQAAQHLRRRIPVYELAVTALGVNAGTWLETPNQMLGGATPSASLDTEEGAEAVQDLLRRVQAQRD